MYCTLRLQYSTRPVGYQLCRLHTLLDLWVTNSWVLQRGSNWEQLGATENLSERSREAADKQLGIAAGEVTGGNRKAVREQQGSLAVMLYQGIAKETQAN
jgi:hypothetical protein